MSSVVENIELKSKEKNNTDKFNLSVFQFNLIILIFWSKATCFQPFCLKAEGVTPLIFLKNLVR